MVLDFIHLTFACTPSHPRSFLSGVGKASTSGGDVGPASWPPQWAGDVSVVSRGPEALLNFDAPGSEGGGAALDHAEAVSRMMAQRSSAGDDSAKWFTALFSALQVRVAAKFPCWALCFFVSLLPSPMPCPPPRPTCLLSCRCAQPKRKYSLCAMFGACS